MPTLNTDEFKLVRLERDLAALNELFHAHTAQDAESFDRLDSRLEKLAVSVDKRFDRLEVLLTEFRLHTARREGGEDAIKRLAGYISGIVAALVSAAGIAIQKLFLE